MRPPVVIIALVHPLNLVMLGLSVVAGLFSAWWLFPVGLLLWLAMVVAVAREPSLRMSYQMSGRAPLAQRFQRYFSRIERSQVAVFNGLASAPPRMRRLLRPIQDELGNVVTQAHAVCARLSALENYRLVAKSRTDPRADLQQVEAKIAGAQDAAVAREYEEARRALQERVRELEATSARLDRAEAQLVNLASALESSVAEVVDLLATGQEATPLVPELVGRLQQQVVALNEIGRTTADA